jgi:hypothetical protein
MKQLITITIWLAVAACNQQEIAPVVSNQKRLSLDDRRVLILVDGKQISSDALQKLDPSQIESIEVIKTPSEVRKYTTDLCEGVVKVSLKK